MATANRDETNEPLERKPKRRFACVTFGWASLLLVIALTVIHYFQPDQLAPVTLIPPWMWLVLAVLVAAISFRDLSKWMIYCTVGAWVLFTYLFAEEARSLFSFRDQPQTLSAELKRSGAVRVMSLNLNMASRAAAKETSQFQPDIILFQESLGEIQLQELSKQFFGESGSHLYGGDVSIVANGQITPIHVDRASHFVHATVLLDNGSEFDIVSLRLSAPVFRIDFWSTGFWSDHERTRKKHRQQIQQVVDHLNVSAKTENWIVGGDFNLVGNDGALSPFAGDSENSMLTDTFHQSGTGWCNTGTSDYPLFRVDQMWTTANLKSSSTKAYKCENSDHRMVVVDFSSRNNQRK